MRGEVELYLLTFLWCGNDLDDVPPLVSGPSMRLFTASIQMPQTESNSLDLMVGERMTYRIAFPHPCPPSPMACESKQ